jgi:hypothetical protein
MPKASAKAERETREAGGRPCETCGNVYDKAFEVVMAGEAHVFDSFECAITALAPRCAQCGGKIIGHGMEKDARMFCCAHCAERQGVPEMRDRV